MTKNKNSYRQIIKATSIFGGVQFFNIIIRIIRSKFIAILLGPEGMGIFGLLNSTIRFIGGLTNFGLETSAVKNVAAANSTGNENRISTIIVVLGKLVWLTGLLGSLVTIILSPILSRITFGSTEYTNAFIWISITLLFNQLSVGQLVILRGLRKLKYLAKASLYGSITGLIITVPLYYFLALKGIVPSIIISSIITMAFSWFFSKKLKMKLPRVRKARTIAESKDMMFMGFMISLSGLITLGVSYLIRIFIRHSGSIEDVGLYNAGFTIINTYVGLIFTAMATDYFPRLSAVAHDNEVSREIINQQAEIAILILAPIVIVFIVFIKWGIILLYSKEFLLVNNMVQWAALGMFFKAVSWSIGFILLAKGKSRLFFFNELMVNIYILALNIYGYNRWGLTGLGVAFLFSYFVYFVQLFVLSKRKFQFAFKKQFLLIFLIQFSLALLCFLNTKFIFNTKYFYTISSVLILFSILYSLKELNSRVPIKEICLKIISKS